jgi:hypothetical protein
LFNGSILLILSYLQLEQERIEKRVAKLTKKKERQLQQLQGKYTKAGSLAGVVNNLQSTIYSWGSFLQQNLTTAGSKSSTTENSRRQQRIRTTVKVVNVIKSSCYILQYIFAIKKIQQLFNKIITYVALLSIELGY